MTEQEKQFAEMLAMDRANYVRLVALRAILSEASKTLLLGKGLTKVQYDAFKKTYDATSKVYYAELKKYNERQTDYNTNTAYKLAGKITAFNDKVVTYFKGLWDFVNQREGLAAAPALLLPVTIAAGAVLTVAVVAYFISKYYTDTANSVPNILEALNEAEALTPELAASIAEKGAELNALTIKENADSGLTNQIGKGVKIAIISISTLAAGIMFFQVAKTQKWI